MSPAKQLPLRAAQIARFEALRAARSGESDTAEQKFKRAGALLREIDSRFWLAVVLLEHGESLVENGEPEEAGPLLAEARVTFEGLGAAPLLERLDTLTEPVRA